MSPEPDGPRWLRRNRWGLLALPFALALIGLTGLQHFRVYYWESGLHAAQHGSQGRWVTFVDRYDDASGHHEDRVQVRLDAVTTTTKGFGGSGPLRLPPHTKGLAVHLSLRADPDVPLRTCSLALTGPDGTRYDYASEVAGVFMPAAPCVPVVHEGPWPDEGRLTAGLDPGPPRPAAWSITPVVVVPSDVSVTAVELWWQLPDYLTLATAPPPL